MGGTQNTYLSKNVWIATLSDNGITFDRGPSMKSYHSHSTCGTINIGDHDKKMIIVAGGNGVCTTEILDPSTTNGQWISGMSRPLT